jgi:hypothetical protein
MPTLPAEILPLLLIFAPAMTAPTYRNALVLLCGAILAPGRRTVCSALRVLGVAEGNFSKYHRVLSRAQWSPMLISHLLLALLVRTFVAPGEPLQLIVDETLERRRGPQVPFKGWFRDGVRSTTRQVVLSMGIRWCCLCLLAKVPWSQRPWALPFLLVPVLSEKACQKWRKRFCGSVGWAERLVERVRRWHPEREITLVGDGGYAAVSLVRKCQSLGKPVRLVSRLRCDAVLHDFPSPQPKDKRGPKPKKGVRQPNLKQRLQDLATCWKRASIPWYGARQKELEIATGVSLWYTPGQNPVPIRWVLVRSPEGDKEPIKAASLFCSDAEVSPEQILAWFIGRWNIEVTFEEIRAHLGFETQRQWSRRAVGRSAPCLFGLFSLVVLLAKALHPQRLPLAQTGWYRKEEATFSDALAAVRRHLWRRMNYVDSPEHSQLCLIPRGIWLQIQEVACYAP